MVRCMCEVLLLYQRVFVEREYKYVWRKSIDRYSSPYLFGLVWRKRCWRSECERVLEVPGARSATEVGIRKA